MPKPDERVRTHKWLRTDRAPEAAQPAPLLKARVPAGAPADAGRIADATVAALAGWPIVVFRAIGVMKGRESFGRTPGRWARRHVGEAIDRFCICRGPRCRYDDCPAGHLLGRHGKGGPTVDGEAWAPLTIRPADLPQGKVSERTNLKMEIVLAGDTAVGAGPTLVEALRDPPPPEGPRAPTVTWSTIQTLVLGDEDELRWKKVDLDGPPPLLPLERLAEPRVRRTRLTLTFLTPAPMSRMGEAGVPTADLSLIVDRMTRSLGAWMGRTGHKGPRLPVDDLLRVAAEATLSADNSRVVELPAAMLGAATGKEAAGDRVPGLTGSITWTGDFSALAPLLRAVHHLGMGPGRHHGLGQIAIR